MKLALPVAHLPAVLDALPQPLLILNPQLDIVGVNQAYADATLTCPEDIVSRHVFEAFPDNPTAADVHAVQNLEHSLTHVIDTGRASVMQRQRYDVRDRSGVFQERWWKPTNTPVLDEQHRLIAILHSVTDVSAEQRTLRALLTRASMLPPRGRDVLSGLARGMTTQQIANTLGLSAKTVEHYRIQLYRHFGVNNPGALIRVGVILSQVEAA